MLQNWRLPLQPPPPPRIEQEVGRRMAVSREVSSTFTWQLGGLIMAIKFI
jgi:hypothetical protein